MQRICHDISFGTRKKPGRGAGVSLVTSGATWRAVPEGALGEAAARLLRLRQGYQQGKTTIPFIAETFSFSDTDLGIDDSIHTKKGTIFVKDPGRTKTASRTVGADPTRSYRVCTILFAMTCASR